MKKYQSINPNTGSLVVNIHFDDKEKSIILHSLSESQESNERILAAMYLIVHKNLDNDHRLWSILPSTLMGMNVANLKEQILPWQSLVDDYKDLICRLEENI